MIIDGIKSSLLIKGDENHAFRDPAVIYEKGVFYLYCTYVETEETGDIYMYTVLMKSKDLISWTEPKKLTPRDKSLNFSSPGNIIKKDGRYIMCLQTYPRQNGEKYGNSSRRIYTMESYDLESWSEPRVIPVKGDMPIEDIGSMIDPYFIYDENKKLWNCFYKQNGVSRSVSSDLVFWEYKGSFDGGENVSVIKKDEKYYMFHSPRNGIGVKISTDLEEWQSKEGLITLGQSEWEWAMGRITAGFVLPYEEKGEKVYLMFFHGTGPQDESVIFDTHACIGLAWSYDLENWIWK